MADSEKEKLITEHPEIKERLDAFIQSGKLQDIFKSQEKLAIVQMSRYGKALVLPYDQAVDFIRTLHQAEEVEVDYNNKISFPEKVELLDVGFKVIDATRYNRAKLAKFLKIDGDAMDTYLNGEKIEDVPF